MCVFLCVLYGNSFERICAKFGHVASLYAPVGHGGRGEGGLAVDARTRPYAAANQCRFWMSDKRGAKLPKSENSELDGCIVWMWNAHNIVFASKRSAICAQAVYFLYSTMSSVMCLRLSDVSVICCVTYFQFFSFQFRSAFLPRRSARRHSGVLGLSNIGHRTLPKIWVRFLYGACILVE